MMPYLFNSTYQLSSSAKALYIHYKWICGDTGRCFQSLSTISKEANLSTPTIVKARRELESEGLIQVNKVSTKGGNKQVNVTIVNLWTRNNKVDFGGRNGSDNECVTPKQNLLNNLFQAIKKLSSAEIKNLSLTISKEEQEEEGGEVKKLRPRPNDFNEKAARRFLNIFRDNNSDLAYPTPPKRPVSVKTIAKIVGKLQDERGVSKEEIKLIVTWYRDHYNDPFTPKIHKVDDLFSSWGRIRDAKARWDHDHGEEDNGKPRTKAHRDRVKKIDQIKIWMMDNTDWQHWVAWPDRSDIDAAIAALGLELDDVTIEEIDMAHK